MLIGEIFRKVKLIQILQEEIQKIIRMVMLVSQWYNILTETIFYLSSNYNTKYRVFLINKLSWLWQYWYCFYYYDVESKRNFEIITFIIYMLYIL